MIKGFTSLTELEKAKEIVFNKIKPKSTTEIISIKESDGRVLSEDLKAEFDLPQKNSSAMDGYAVLVSDLERASPDAPVKLDCIDELWAESPADKKLRKGTCAKVATGAEVPANTDAVVRVEDVEAVGNRIRFFKSADKWENINRAGEDIKKGEVVIGAGTLLNHTKIGAIARLGISSIKVFQKPRVSIASTGNEIKMPGEKLNSNEVYDTNSFMLASTVKFFGGIPSVFGPIPDESESIEKFILEKAKGHDLIITTGGSSVGERDLIFKVASKLGQVYFHGVGIKPGMPTLFAVINEKPYLALPGYPASCMMSCYQFLPPAFNKLLNTKVDLRKTNAKMGADISVRGNRVSILPVKLTNGIAWPTFKGSGFITSISSADGWIEIKPGRSVSKGDQIEVAIW
jgi:molybdenum cofactor synthesis domain-containing protein